MLEQVGQLLRSPEAVVFHTAGSCFDDSLLLALLQASAIPSPKRIHSSADKVEGSDSDTHTSDYLMICVLLTHPATAMTVIPPILMRLQTLTVALLEPQLLKHTIATVTAGPGY